MPVWEGPPLMIPRFEGVRADGQRIRSDDFRQRRHLIIAFAGARENGALEAVVARSAEILAHDACLLVVVPSSAHFTTRANVPLVQDVGGRIEFLFKGYIDKWLPPVFILADRYGELKAWEDGRNPNAAEDILSYLMYTEMECAS
jgi:hypothetical protein